MENWSGFQIIGYHPVDAHAGFQGCHNITGLMGREVNYCNNCEGDPKTNTDRKSQKKCGINQKDYMKQI